MCGENDSFSPHALKTYNYMWINKKKYSLESDFVEIALFLSEFCKTSTVDRKRKW